MGKNNRINYISGPISSSHRAHYGDPQTARKLVMMTGLHSHAITFAGSRKMDTEVWVACYTIILAIKY